MIDVFQSVLLFVKIEIVHRSKKSQATSVFTTWWRMEIEEIEL